MYAAEHAEKVSQTKLYYLMIRKSDTYKVSYILRDAYSHSEL